MSKKRNKPNKPRWDEKLMSQLLAEPDVAKSVAKMAPAEVEMLKSLLYRSGTYQRYVLEQQKQAIKDAWKGAAD